MIEILVVHDPDSGPEVSVWQDGHQLSQRHTWEDYRVVVIDAGRGYAFEDWRETADGFERDDELSDGFREAIVETMFDPPGSKYIEGFRELDRYPFLCRTCGRTGTEDDMCVLGEECPADDCDGIIEHNWKEPE